MDCTNVARKMAECGDVRRAIRDPKEQPDRRGNTNVGQEEKLSKTEAWRLHGEGRSLGDAGVAPDYSM